MVTYFGEDLEQSAAAKWRRGARNGGDLCARGIPVDYSRMYRYASSRKRRTQVAEDGRTNGTVPVDTLDGSTRRDAMPTYEQMTRVGSSIQTM
jgi:hypothetical protein